MISASEDSRKEYEIIKLGETVNRLIEILDAHGINVDELKPKTVPVPESLSFTYSPEDLPF